MSTQSTGQHADDKKSEHGTGTQGPYLIAYRLGSGRVGPPIIPAPNNRPWMTSTYNHFANRCLPLLIANGNGWFILNNHTFVACWSGKDGKEEIHIEYLSGAEPYPAHSHFGYGILTWKIPYLFRTSTGYNLLVRGPANYPKDGVFALEGIVETDWAIAPFTYNLKLTRPDLPVRFDVGEPICMLVPQRRGELETFRPVLHTLESEPDIHSQYLEWNQSRKEFLASLGITDASKKKDLWQKHYFRGTSPGGVYAPVHQLKLKLREFDEAIAEKLPENPS